MVFFAETPINSAYKSSYCFYLRANFTRTEQSKVARSCPCCHHEMACFGVNRKAERIRIMEAVMTERAPMNRA